MARLPPGGWVGPVRGSAVPARPRRERAQSVAEASRLRQEGLLLREIGAQMGVSAKTVHAWLSDPDGSKARERKSRYHDGVCRDCGGPCYRYWSDSRGGYTAWRCQKCERQHCHEQRTWTKRKVRAALARWADDLGRPPTAEETGLPGTRVPYRAIQREFGSFSSGAEGRRAAGARAWPPCRKERAAGPRRAPVGRWLAAGALPHPRSAPQAELPAAGARAEARLPAADRGAAARAACTVARRPGDPSTTSPSGAAARGRS